MASTSAADEDVGFDISSTDTLSVTKLQPVYLNHRRNRRRRKRNASTPPPNKLPPGPEYTPPIPMPLSSKSSKSGKKSSSSKSLSSKSSFSKSGKKSKSKGKKCKKSDKSDKCDEEPEMFTDAPTTAPTLAPTLAPVVPSPGPTAAPTATSVPTILGTEPPSRTPSATDPPSPVPDEPSASPSKVPTEEPAEDFETTLGLAEVATQYQSAFTNAATRWDSIIVGDEEDVVVTAQDKTDSMCTDSGIPDLIDDIYICAVIEDIDGPGQILGSAGPELAIFGPGSRVRPFIGRMRFDTADVDGLVAAGTFEGVIVSTFRFAAFVMKPLPNILTLLLSVASSFKAT